MLLQAIEHFVQGPCYHKAVRRMIQAATGEQGELLILVKKRKQRWLGHISWSSAVAKTILSGTVKGTTTVRKSDYTPALALSKHMASVFDEKYRQKEIRVLNRTKPVLNPTITLTNRNTGYTV